MPRIRLQPEGAAEPLVLELEWGPETEGLATAELRIEGREWTARGKIEPDGEGFLQVESRALTFYALRVDDRLEVWIDGELYRFMLPDEARAGIRGAQVAPAGGEVRSPMPGRVLKVPVRPGEEVAAGAPLAVLESMKMELTVPAPAEGTVAEVCCEPGQMVDRDDLLLRLELSEG